MAQADNSKETKPEASGEDEFLIAADLTLYANPLRCLTSKTKKKPSDKDKASEENPKGTNEKKEEKEMIAADLTKYGSPLDDRD